MVSLNKTLMVKSFYKCSKRLGLFSGKINIGSVAPASDKARAAEGRK